jgi:hypothetical protein
MTAAILAFLISLTAFAQIAFVPTAYAADSKAPPIKPLQSPTAQDDKAIEAAIRAKLAKSKIGKDGLKVRVQGGVAYWDGSTRVVQHKGSATRMAKTAGAKKVIINIKVSDDAKEKAAGNLEEGRRRAQVKRSDPRNDGQSSGTQTK